MTFNIIAMICVAGMSPANCGPEPGFSRDVAVIGQVSNEFWCGVEAQQDLAKSAPFRNLAEGEFIKIMCVRNGSPSGEPLAPAPARAPETIESPAKPRAARNARVSAE